MTGFDANVRDVHVRQTALRGECGILVQRVADPNARRVVADLRDLHSRQTIEVAALLTAAGAQEQVLGGPDAVAGDEHPATLAEGVGAGQDALQALATAEEDLVASYDAAVEATDADTPARSLLLRHRTVLSTAIQQLRLVAASTLA